MASRYHFEWNKTKSILIYDKGFTPDFYKKMAEICQSHFYKYIPYDPTRTAGEHLADSTRISKYSDHATITYMKPYTRPVYKGEHPETGTRYQFQKVPHALATSYWDQAAWTNEGSVISREINAARKKYAK